MRLATVISLLQLLACAAYALQLHPEDGFRSSVIARRSSRANLRRRLATSRRIGSSVGPDIVSRGNPMLPPPSAILNQLIRFKQNGGVTPIVTSLNGNVQIYRVNFHLYFKGHLVVKEIKLAASSWSKDSLEKEVRGVRAANQLYGVLFHEESYFILMKDMGKQWTVNHTPSSSESMEHMKQADKRYEEVYFVKRGTVLAFRSYTWNRRPDNTWDVEPVGSWRYAEFIGGESPIPKDRHYCGIKEWDKDGLPVFSMASSTAYYTG